MRFATVCSGIEAPSVAWPEWEPVFFSEIEPFPCSVLKAHYPHVLNYGDMTKYKEWPDAAVELICTGTPCQSFSVAGLRRGLDDPRGNLTLVLLGILERYRPRWVVWENVPGVLSIDKGRAFGAFLGGLAKLGYGFAYRILDAQYAGVPQRRRRVFVVGYFGEWRYPAAVLFERHSLQGHTPPRRETGERTTHELAPSLTSSGRGVERTGESRGQDPVIVHSLRAEGFDASEDGTGRGTPLVCGTLACNAGPRGHDAGNFYCNQAVDSGYVIPVAIANGGNTSMVALYENHGQDARIKKVDVCPQINAKAGTGGNNLPLVGGMRVRRLLPIECERLQGMPDNYTLIEYRNKPAKDGPRYKAIGNSMAVPVVAWIGNRIDMVENIIKQQLTEGTENAG